MIIQKIPQKKKKRKKIFPVTIETNINTNKQQNKLFENNKRPLSQNNNKYPYLNVATINVKGLTIEKRQFILDLMDEKKINILGISETSLKNSEARYIYNNITNKYISYFTNTTDDH